MSELIREFPAQVSRREMGEWTVSSNKVYNNPFVDVVVKGIFTAPSGKTFRQEAFYDGNQMWRLRFNLAETGRWTFQLVATPPDPDLTHEGSFEVTAAANVIAERGFLRVTPGEGWGFQYEGGQDVFILGDTVYHLFGMALCGCPVESFMARRAEQGFNLLRVRVPISYFHPPHAYNQWQDRIIWAWGGSSQSPQFDRFNLEYFQTIDTVMRTAERLGIGIELILEAWGAEFPFNQRQVFLPEWEDLWICYLVARYSAFKSLYIWTGANEYEYYPDGNPVYKHVADLWLMRISQRLKQLNCHQHPVALHNLSRIPTFAERFAIAPDTIDIVLLQEWGTHDQAEGWLASGIETNRHTSLKNWPGSVLLAEYGYERNPALLPSLVPLHDYCDSEHTRRGAWRGAMSGWGVIHGFENSWGPFALLDEDLPGLEYLLHLRRFFTQVVPFAQLQPVDNLIKQHESYPGGQAPLVLADKARRSIVIYLPTGLPVQLNLPEFIKPVEYSLAAFNPVTGELNQISQSVDLAEPLAVPTSSKPKQDWILVLQSN